MNIARSNPSFFTSGRLRYIFNIHIFCDLGRVQGSCVYDGSVLACASCVCPRFSRVSVYDTKIFSRLDVDYKSKLAKNLKEGIAFYGGVVLSCVLRSKAHPEVEVVALCKMYRRCHVQSRFRCLVFHSRCSWKPRVCID